MKRLLSVVLFIVFLPLLATAQNDFEGTWKVDLTKSGMPDKADVLLLQNGTYQCKTCVPPINLKADGEDHGTIHPEIERVVQKNVSQIGLSPKIN